MDYTQIKKILLAEYTANGGTNTREFLRGMNYLEDYLESGRGDHFLNTHVDELAFLRKRVEKLGNEVVELERTLKHKQNIIRQYRQMNKDERYKWKASQELMRLERMYSRMVMELEEKYKRRCFRHKPADMPFPGNGKPDDRKIFKAQVS